jgi:GTP:adenosylcobinamide-phosphate guanylyltransferase
MKNGYPVASLQIDDTDEIFGINFPEDLKRAEKLLKK